MSKYSEYNKDFQDIEKFIEVYVEKNNKKIANYIKGGHKDFPFLYFYENVGNQNDCFKVVYCEDVNCQIEPPYTYLLASKIRFGMKFPINIEKKITKANNDLKKEYHYFLNKALESQENS